MWYLYPYIHMIHTSIFSVLGYLLYCIVLYSVLNDRPLTRQIIERMGLVQIITEISSEWERGPFAR